MKPAPSPNRARLEGSGAPTMVTSPGAHAEVDAAAAMFG